MAKLMKAVALVALVSSVACARAYPPPGGERDVQAPRLLGTTPGPLEVVPGFSGPAVFRFDERLSERGFAESLVVVSPLDSTIRVQRGRTEIRVELEGGWRPDRVYRVVLLPGIRDLFGNERREQAEIVFSTGPPVSETAIAGIVQDRLTGTAAASPVVQAVRRADGVLYTAMGDNTGFYSLRHLPLGTYDVIAFADQNRNRRMDPAEALDSMVLSLGTHADTVAAIFNVLRPDSTPPQVSRAEAVDSLHVRVTFDDHFDSEQPLQGATAEVHALPDSTRFAGSVRLVQAPVWDAEQRELAAAARAQADSVAADTAAAPPDTVAGTPPDTLAARPTPPARAPAAAPPGRAQPTGPPLPTREIIVVLDRPLTPGDYVVSVRGAVNINGLTGGGTARFEVAAPPDPPPPPPIPPDSAGIR